MKRFLIIVLLLSLVSCTSSLKSNLNGVPASMASIEPSATNTTKPEVTTTQRPTSTATIKPAATTISLPKETATPPVFSVIQKEYYPSEWKFLYDKGTVWEIDLDNKEQIWIKDGLGQVGYLEEDNWVLYSQKDYGFTSIPHDMAIASDGTIWLAGKYEISHYQNGIWNVYSIPDASETSFSRIAIDSSNLVWLTLDLCYCENNLRIFDGSNWDKQTEPGEADQLLFTPDGTLWATFGRAIGHFNGKTWSKYSGRDLWLERDYFYNVRIASDSQGNIFGISAWQEWIVKINQDGSITKIPFDFVHYEFNEMLMRIFIDKQGRIWTNACLKDNIYNCLEYYENNQWISFKDLPFWDWYDMSELSDGTLLVATNKGLFQYKPTD